MFTSTIMEVVNNTKYDHTTSDVLTMLGDNTDIRLLLENLEGNENTSERLFKAVLNWGCLYRLDDIKGYLVDSTLSLEDLSELKNSTDVPFIKDEVNDALTGVYDVAYKPTFQKLGKKYKNIYFKGIRSFASEYTEKVMEDLGIPSDKQDRDEREVHSLNEMVNMVETYDHDLILSAYAGSGISIVTIKLEDAQLVSAIHNKFPYSRHRKILNRTCGAGLNFEFNISKEGKHILEVSYVPSFTTYTKSTTIEEFRGTMLAKYWSTLKSIVAKKLSANGYNIFTSAEYDEARGRRYENVIRFEMKNFKKAVMYKDDGEETSIYKRMKELVTPKVEKVEESVPKGEENVESEA